MKIEKIKPSLYEQYHIHYQNKKYIIYQEEKTYDYKYLIIYQHKYYILALTKQNKWLKTKFYDKKEKISFNSFDDALNHLKKYLNVKNKKKIKTCICTNWDLFHFGCKCGFQNK